MTVAERVRLLLTLKNVGFADIAKAAGLDRQAVWKIVRGDTPNPGILTIEKIVTAAGSTVIEYYSLKELSMADQLVQEVRRVLLNATDGKGTAPGFLTAFQILRPPAAGAAGRPDSAAWRRRRRFGGLLFSDKRHRQRDQGARERSRAAVHGRSRHHLQSR